VLLAAQARVPVDPHVLAGLTAAAEVTLPADRMATLKGHEIAASLHQARLERLKSIYG
jgi:hypothetical protein